MNERLPRKLAAILYADVAGYSRLTGDDEEATHRRLRDYLDLIAETIENHHGQVTHYAGDAALAKFDAVVDALSSAIAIQNEHMLKEMGFRNARNCLGYRLVVKNIERAGDHASFIAKDLLEFKKPVKKEILEKLQDMNEFCLSVLDESCLALFKEDYVQAEKIIEKTAEIAKYEKKVRDASKSLKDDEEIYRIRRMSENIRRVSEYASDIAEIVLNMNIEKVLKKTE